MPVCVSVREKRTHSVHRWLVSRECVRLAKGASAFGSVRIKAHTPAHTHIVAVRPISQKEGACLAVSSAFVPCRLAKLCAKPHTSVLLMMGSGGRFGG